MSNFIILHRKNIQISVTKTYHYTIIIIPIRFSTHTSEHQRNRCWSSFSIASSLIFLKEEYTISSFLICLNHLPLNKVRNTSITRILTRVTETMVTVSISFGRIPNCIHLELDIAASPASLKAHLLVKEHLAFHPFYPFHRCPLYKNRNDSWTISCLLSATTRHAAFQIEFTCLH